MESSLLTERVLTLPDQTVVERIRATLYTVSESFYIVLVRHKPNLALFRAI